MLSKSFLRRKFCKVPCRTFATSTRPLPSDIYSNPSRAQDAGRVGTPQDISPGQRNSLDAALRVDQAGEVAANYIYMGQIAVLGKDRIVGPLLKVRI